MEVAVGAAGWVVGKALGPVADGLLEAWAASTEFGPNIDALKMELLYAQGMLNNTRGREIDNPALNVLLQKLRDLAYNSEDVLDELDYFRLKGTYKADDELAKGCVCNLFRNAHHTAKAVGKLLCASPCSRAAGHGDLSEPTEEDAKKQVPRCAWPCAKRSSARDNTSSVPHHHQADEEVSGCTRKLASSACNAIRDVGKRLHCSSLPLTHDDDDNSGSSLPLTHDDDDNSGMPVLCCACNTRKVSQKRHTKETPLKFDKVDLSKRMKNIVEQLQPVCAKVTAILNLELLGSRITDPNIAKSPPTTTSDIIEPKWYGRVPTMKSIIGSITQDNGGTDPITVLPIVGPGGIGKTTLVQHIYHSEEVQNHFQVKVWVCVSQNFNVNRLIEEIKNAIPRVEGETGGTSQELIEHRLKSKRLLLILDDIWKCEPVDWERLLVPLGKGQAKGNIILVTTRFPAIAEMVKTTGRRSEYLEGLDDEVFRDFFQACIFGEGQSRKYPEELLEIGDKIAKKLKGNPLAAKTVGRLLRNHLDHNHWTRVLKNREWEMQNGEHDIMPALKLSFDYLPFHLQQCFSYCALFPEDYKFYSEELIHFWIGLDILHSCGSRKKSVEDVGLDSLNDLVNHGFFKKDGTDRHPYYIIHDLLHDLALKVASQECLSLHHSNVRSVEIRPSIRHLSIIIDGADDSYGMPDENFKSELRKLNTRLKVENLQTLIILRGHDKSFVNIFGPLFKKANALRVLCLPIITYPVDFILCNFSALLHLRYLRLGTFQREMDLPTSLSRFYHLRVLHLQPWYGCLDLPRDMSNLAKLRHFVTQHDELHSAISNVGKLQFLQELKKFQVKKETVGFELEQLGHLMELRGLGIYNLERIQGKEEADQAKLISKDHMHKLTLEWESSSDPDLEAVVLESLRPHNSLQELRIRGHGGRSCPIWLDSDISVKALTSLHLVGVGWNSLPCLGQMWVLNELKLEGIAVLSEFDPHHFGIIKEQSFKKLGSLTLIALKRLERLIVAELSGLQVLVIRDCPELLEFPFLNNACYASGKDENMRWLPRLRNIAIEDCPKLSSLPPIPYTDTLCSVYISGVGSGLERLVYSNQESSLRIEGNEILHSLDDTVLAFHNLNQLQNLKITKCPPLAGKHLQMLTSLQELQIHDSSNVFLPSASSDVKWRIPVKHLELESCGASGKELTQLLSHLPELSELWIMYCEKITLLGVESEQQETAAPISLPSASAVKMEDAQATDQHQQIAGEVVEEEVAVELVAEQEEEDGLLLIPTHLSVSLQELAIGGCSELSLMASPTLPDGHNKIGGRGGEGGGLQALHSLQELDIWGSPKFLSAYKTSSVCPFPSSLRVLSLRGMEGMKTFEPLSNLTSLTQLCIGDCGEDLRWEGLWPLHTQGQLSNLSVRKSPKFFVGSDPVRGLQDEEEQQLLPSSFKLRELDTDDVAGVLVAPVCSLLSSSLTELSFKEVVRFTKEQDEALQLLTSLQELQFLSCEKLQCLPAGLNKLTNLKALDIWECPSLRSLPKDGLPSSLQELDVGRCGNEELKQKCRRFTGTIPKIRL